MTATLTVKGVIEGVRLMRPAIPPVGLFGIAVGAAASQKGLTLIELTVMNATVFAGAAQLVVLGLWQERWTWAALLSIVIVTATVNARLILMGASLRPWIGGMRGSRVYPILFFLTDTSWIASQRYRAEGGTDIGTMLGGGLLLWVVWLVAPIPGFMLGELVHDPRVFAIDLVMPVFFVAMVARLWKGRGDSIAWIAAGLVGLVVHKQAGGALHVVAGALVAMAIAAISTPSRTDDASAPGASP